jgi:hypothetical protein
VNREEARTVEDIASSLRRIADALERSYPKPYARDYVAEQLSYSAAHPNGGMLGKHPNER